MRKYKAVVFFVAFTLFFCACKTPPETRESDMVSASCEEMTIKITEEGRAVQYNFVSEKGRRILRFEGGALTHDLTKIVTTGEPYIEQNSPGAWCARGAFVGDECVAQWWALGLCLDVR